MPHVQEQENSSQPGQAVSGRTGALRAPHPPPPSYLHTLRTLKHTHLHRYRCISTATLHTLTRSLAHSLRPQAQWVSPIAPNTAQGSVLCSRGHFACPHSWPGPGQSSTVVRSGLWAQTAWSHPGCVALGVLWDLLSLSPSSVEWGSTSHL